MKRYRVLSVDSPWRYQNFSDAAHGAASAHYDGMTLRELAGLRHMVKEIAAPDAIMAFWGCWPKVDDAVLICRAWGFPQVTGWPWVKTIPSSRDIYTGIGFWVQGASEFCLARRRGNPEKYAKGEKHLGLMTGEPRQFYAPKSRRHSEKPEGVQDLLESMFEGPYLELFARRDRPGWDCWGSDLGLKLSASGVSPCAVPVEPMPLFDGKHYGTGGGA